MLFRLFYHKNVFITGVPLQNIPFSFSWTTVLVFTAHLNTMYCSATGICTKLTKTIIYPLILYRVRYIEGFHSIEVCRELCRPICLSV